MQRVAIILLPYLKVTHSLLHLFKLSNHNFFPLKYFNNMHPSPKFSEFALPFKKREYKMILKLCSKESKKEDSLEIKQIHIKLQTRKRTLIVSFNNQLDDMLKKKNKIKLALSKSATVLAYSKLCHVLLNQKFLTLFIGCL